MRIAHLADLHLGFRAYHRTTPQGINWREQDVAGAFRCALEGVVRLRPDLIVVAGDLFHSVRPSNHALVDAFRRWTWVREQLPATPIVLVGGNHDLPKSADVGCILRLFTEIPNVRVALEPTTFEFQDLHVRCLPDSPRPVEIGRPSPTARYNVLVTHGETPAMAARWGDMRSHNTLDPDGFAGWDYVALGHYHVAHQVAPNAWYAGSLEYTSSNPWGELQEQRERGLEGKGWLAVQLCGAEGLPPTVDFQPVRTRTFHDLPPIDATGLTAADVMARIAAQIPELEGAVVRQKVLNLSRDTAHALDQERLRTWKARALYFQLDLRKAAREILNGQEVAAVRQRKPLMEQVAEFFRNRELPPDLDRERFAAAAEKLMAEASAAEEQQA